MSEKVVPKKGKSNVPAHKLEEIRQREIFLARLAGKFTDSHIARRLSGKFTISGQTVYDYRRAHNIAKAPLKKRKKTKMGQARTPFPKKNLPTIFVYEDRFIQANRRKSKNPIEVYVFNNLKNDEIIRLEKLRIEKLRHEGFRIINESEIIRHTLRECETLRKEKSARERI